MVSIPSSPFPSSASDLAAAASSLQSDVVDTVTDAVTVQVTDVAREVAVPVAKLAALHLIRTRAKAIAILLLILIALPIGLKLLWDSKKSSDDPIAKSSSDSDGTSDTTSGDAST